MKTTINNFQKIKIIGKMLQTKLFFSFFLIKVHFPPIKSSVNSTVFLFKNSFLFIICLLQLFQLKSSLFWYKNIASTSFNVSFNSHPPYLWVIRYFFVLLFLVIFWLNLDNIIVLHTQCVYFIILRRIKTYLN